MCCCTYKLRQGDEMNYNKCYQSLVEKCQIQNRVKGDGCYYEAHHIIPKCLGGTDNKNNLVLLTAREHFIAHWLLAKINPLNFKVQCAWNAFCMPTCNGDRPTSKLYEYARLNFIKALQINKEERNRKNSETHKNMRWINNGEISTKIHISKLDYYLKMGWIRGRLYFKRTPHSDKHKEKISKGNKGKIRSEEVKAIHSNNNKNRVWINNGEICKMVKENILDNYLLNGWVKGRIKHDK